MPLQNVQRCPHFQLHVELLSTEGPPAYLAVRHCLLTARLLTLLQPFPDTQPMTQRLIIRTERSESYAFVGPDLEAVTQAACTQNRCNQSCTQAYKETLQQFDVVDPQEASVTCDEQDAQPGPHTVESASSPSACS